MLRQGPPGNPRPSNSAADTHQISPADSLPPRGPIDSHAHPDEHTRSAPYVHGGAGVQQEHTPKTIPSGSAPPEIPEVSRDGIGGASGGPSADAGDASVDDIDDDEEPFVFENQNLGELPPQITETILGRKNLQKLSLKGNHFRSLPDRIGELSRLYYLNLSHNQFTEVPVCVGELQSLEILDMSNNSLKTLPAFLMRLPHLVALSLVANNFEVLPPIIADLPRLEFLELEDNPIQVPANVPSIEDAEDEESWLHMIRECIRTHRAELEHHLRTRTRSNSRAQVKSRSNSQGTSQVPSTSTTQSSGPRGAAVGGSAVTGALNPPPDENTRRLSAERLRSASESGMSLRAAKRMGFVMSRNATDQSYVASLHARGLSHDAHMIDGTPPKGLPKHAASHSMSSSSSSHANVAGAAPQSGAAGAGAVGAPPMAQHSNSFGPEAYQHLRSMSTFAAMPEGPELQPLPPRSPLSRSPYGSPWGSPRPSVSDAETAAPQQHAQHAVPQQPGSLGPSPSSSAVQAPPAAATSSNKLGTLTEEHDADSEADIGPSTHASRESTLVSDAGNYPSMPRRSSNATKQSTNIPETVSESIHENDPQPPSLTGLFKESFTEHPPQASGTPGTGTPGAVSGPLSATRMPSISAGRQLSISSHRTNSSTPSLQTPTSGNASAIESVSFAIETVSNQLNMLASAVPSAILSGLRDTQELLSSRQYGRALAAFASVLDRLTIPVTFQQIVSRLSRRQQRQFATSIMLAFPELESAWRQLQRTKLIPIAMDASSHPNTLAQDEQLHSQLDFATKSTQSVLSLLNNVIAKSAAAAADSSEPAPEMAIRVRDLSGVCIRCSSATRSVRHLLDRQAAAHARTLQISERRRFWEEVNMFLKAVIATLAGVRAALPDMPLLADSRVGSEVANLSRVAKEIPPLLEQSSYKVLLDTSGSTLPENFDVNTSANTTAGGTIGGASGAGSTSMSSSSYVTSSSLGSPPVPLHFNQLHSQSHPPPMGMAPLNIQAANNISQTPGGLSHVALPPPTPLTASLGAAAQALISPNERNERADGYIQYGIQGMTEM